MLIANSYLVGVCAMPPYSFHCSQGFHDREIAHPNEADPRIVQVDSHPQCDRKNNFRPAFDGGEDAAWIGGPDEWFCIGVVLRDEAMMAALGRRRIGRCRASGAGA